MVRGGGQLLGQLNGVQCEVTGGHALQLVQQVGYVLLGKRPGNVHKHLQTHSRPRQDSETNCQCALTHPPTHTPAHPRTHTSTHIHMHRPKATAKAPQEPRSTSAWSAPSTYQCFHKLSAMAPHNADGPTTHTCAHKITAHLEHDALSFLPCTLARVPHHVQRPAKTTAQRPQKR